MSGLVYILIMRDNSLFVNGLREKIFENLLPFAVPGRSQKAEAMARCLMGIIYPFFSFYKAKLIGQYFCLVGFAVL